jgi:NAD(P)-dependent dehydrogenase (short-subunit alcohol dehydrogenase family)
MAQKWTAADIPPLDGKLAVVTGANRGLGLDVAKALAQHGAQLVMAVRDPVKSAAAVAEVRTAAPGASVTVLPLDLADLWSIRAFAGQIGGRLDILVNNASAILVPQSKTKDGFEMHFGVNLLGTFALTGLLLDRLRATKGARIVNTGSTAHRLVKGLDLGDLDFTRSKYKPMEAYGRSKLATLLFTFELDRRLRKAGADTLAVAAHPGYSNTKNGNGGRFMTLLTDIFAQPAAMGALPTLYAATAPGIVGGAYYGPDGMGEMRGHPTKVEAKPTALDPELAARLWTLSETMTGVPFLTAA